KTAAMPFDPFLFGFPIQALSNVEPNQEPAANPCYGRLFPTTCTILCAAECCCGHAEACVGSVSALLLKRIHLVDGYGEIAVNTGFTARIVHIGRNTG